MASESLFTNLNKMIEQVGKDKGIDKAIISEAVVQGLLTAARKKYGTYRDIEAQMNEDSGDCELLEFKEVVADEDFIDEEVEIPLSEAKKLDPNAEIADSLGIKLETKDLGRIAAQTAKQIIMQRMREAERDIIFAEFDQRKGEIVSGLVRRVERNNIIVDMGRTEALLPPREQIPGELYKPGDRIQGYLIEVRQNTRGPQIIMSRASELYMAKLFEQEVPEINEGIVEIVSAAREPGQRAKIAVRSKDGAVDPVGACVGMKGSRVQTVVQELRGEKIDIVPYDEDAAQFVCNALQPAEIAKVFIDEAKGEMEIVVPDNQLSLAIGRRGQNVRLAAKLTGWKLDIISETDASARTAESIFNLTLIPGLTETMAQSIFQSGFGSFQMLAAANPDDVVNIPGYDSREKAEKLIAEAQALVQRYETSGESVPKAPSLAPSKETQVTGGATARATADARLKEELAQLNQSQVKENE